MEAYKKYVFTITDHPERIATIAADSSGCLWGFSKNFRLQKSNCKFSKITADQNYDEKNAKIKGIGGATGLIKNEMICGSEISLSY